MLMNPFGFVVGGIFQLGLPVLALMATDALFFRIRSSMSLLLICHINACTFRQMILTGLMLILLVLSRIAPIQMDNRQFK